MFTLIILIIIIKAAAASACFRDRGTPDHTPLSTYLHNYLLCLVSSDILTRFNNPGDKILILIYEKTNMYVANLHTLDGRY